jgi:DNA-binding response OmpR family regulator
MKAEKKILLVEDERYIAKAASAYLEGAGFRVVAVCDGLQAIRVFREEEPTLIVLDLMLPGLDGLEVARVIRRESMVPIIMLTARTQEPDRVLGFELGADDYMVKPFSLRELLARIRAVLRRVDGDQPSPLVVGQLTIDCERRQVTLNKKMIELTSTEFDLLMFLAQNSGKVFTRLQLLEQLRGYPYACFDRTIDAHIKNLRRKIEPDVKEPKYILTVQGVGYKLVEPCSP